MSGTNKDQHVLREVAEPFMKDLTFDADGLARSYRAFVANEGDIVMDPARRFGQPVVAKCGYIASVLVEAYRSEGSVAAAAETYGVGEDDVLLAIRYDDYLQGATAA